MSKPMSREQMQAMLSSSGYNAFMGFIVESADPENQVLQMKLPWRSELERGSGTGQFHGGAVATLIDTAGHYACMMTIGAPLPTMNFRVDYLRPAVDTQLHATARVWRIGRTMSVVDVEVTNDSGKTLAIGRANYATPAKA